MLLLAHTPALLSGESYLGLSSALEMQSPQASFLLQRERSWNREKSTFTNFLRSWHFIYRFLNPLALKDKHVCLAKPSFVGKTNKTKQNLWNMCVALKNKQQSLLLQSWKFWMSSPMHNSNTSEYTLLASFPPHQSCLLLVDIFNMFICLIFSNWLSVLRMKGRGRFEVS